MQKRFIKEARLLAPAWIATLLLPVAAYLLFDRSEVKEIAVMLLFVGCATLGASSFGFEFSHRTLAQLLAQPIERRRLWFEKMVVLGLSLLPFLAGLFYLFCWRQGKFSQEALHYFIPLCAFCATPFLTLVTRSMIGGIVFSLAIPMLLSLGGSALIIRMLNSNETSPSRGVAWSQAEIERMLGGIYVALAAYCAVTYWLGYRKFKKLQVTDSAPAEMPLPQKIEALLQSVLHALVSPHLGVWSSLIKKELRLQQTAFLLVASVVLIEICAVLFVNIAQPEDCAVYFGVPFVIYEGIIPLTIGAVSVSEERNFGVHPWQLTLPVSTAKQWLAKIAVALGLSFVLGVVLPWAVLWIGHGLIPSIPGGGRLQFGPTFMLSLTQMLFTALAIYASSLSGNTLRAAILGGGLAVGSGVLITLVTRIPEKVGQVGHDVIRQFSASHHFSSEEFAWFLFGLGAIAMMTALILLLRFSLTNYRLPESAESRCGKQLCAIYGPSLFVLWFIANLTNSFVLHN